MQGSSSGTAGLEAAFDLVPATFAILGVRGWFCFIIKSLWKV